MNIRTNLHEEDVNFLDVTKKQNKVFKTILFFINYYSFVFIFSFVLNT